MGRAPLRSLLRVQPEPETTLDLSSSVARPEATVGTYIFTDAIRHHVEGIFERVVQGKGQGFWIQAEYGAGKTHLLATLTCLLSGSDTVWERVRDDVVRRYRSRLRSSRLFPVVISLRGEAATDALNTRPLFDVVERGLERSLDRLGLRDAVRLTRAEDLLRWLEQRPEGTRQDIEAYVKQHTGLSLSALRETEGAQELARHVAEYCAEQSFLPQVASSVKDRLGHIYEQLTSPDLPGGAYDGLLFVIDEYEGWEKSRLHDQMQQSRDEDLLETMAFVLPRSEGLRIFTVVASQTAVPAKLRGEHGGDRFINMPLLAGAEHDYDMIVSRRVRELEPEHEPEIAEYYHYYAQQFDFARGLDEGRFRDIFPFQPRCFEVARRITARDLPTARSGILIFWQVLNQSPLLDRDTLIRVADLLESDHLVQCLNTPVYRPAFDSYRVARDSLESLGLDTPDLKLAQDVLATLFLWHLTHLEHPQALSFQDLAQATLTVSDLLRADDAVAYVLSRVQELPQVRVEDQKAEFVVAGGDGPTPPEVFEHFRQEALRDTVGLAQAWTRGLFLSPSESGGQPGLFGDFKPDEMKPYRVESHNLEYGGQVVVATRWQLDWGLELPREDVHFSLVILARPPTAPLKAEHLQDSRTAVIVPPELDGDAQSAVADYLACEKMAEHYRDRNGPEAEGMRAWLETKRTAVLRNLPLKQTNVYRSATVVTRDGLAMDLREALVRPNTEQRIAAIVDRLLTAAYHALPLQPARLRGVLRPNDVGKLYEGLFGRAATSASRAALRNYGVGLGLVDPDQPTGFRPTACRALDLIGQMLDEYQAQGHELPAWRVYERLSRPPYGLPYPLIQLYLLAFVRHGQPPVELTLKPNHALRLRDGQPLPRPSLNMSNVAHVEWRLGLDRGFDALMPASGPTWNEVVPFAQLIKADLHTTSEPVEIERQADGLCAALKSLQSETQTVRGSLETLARSLKASLPDEATEVLQRMHGLGQSGSAGFVAFHNQVQEWYGAPEALGESVRVYRRLRDLAGVAGQVQETCRYLEDVALRPSDSELAGERLLLLGQMALAELIREPNLWSGLAGQFRQFQGRYRAAYQKHHRDHYAALERLRARLEDASRSLHALTLLDAIPELGIPVGGDLAARYDTLRGRMRPCPVTKVAEVDVTARPTCAACGLRLTDPDPTGAVEMFLNDLERALQEQRRRLSAEAVRRVLERAGGDELSRLVEAAHAAEIARLVDVLDENVAGSIRRLLVEDGLVTAPTEVLARLAELHPTVGEEEVPTTVRDLEKLLREALQEAKKAHPGKRTVRLGLR